MIRCGSRSSTRSSYRLQVDGQAKNETVVALDFGGEVVGDPEVALREVEDGPDGGFEPLAGLVEEVLLHQAEAEAGVLVHFPGEVCQCVVLADFVTDAVPIDGEVGIGLQEEVEVVREALVVPDRPDQAEPAVAGHERSREELQVRVAEADLWSDVAEHLRRAGDRNEDRGMGVHAAGDLLGELEVGERSPERHQQLALGLESLRVGGRGEDSETEQSEQGGSHRAVHGCLQGCGESIRTHRNM